MYSVFYSTTDGSLAEKIFWLPTATLIFWDNRILWKTWALPVTFFEYYVFHLSVWFLLSCLLYDSLELILAEADLYIDRKAEKKGSDNPSFPLYQYFRKVTENQLLWSLSVTTLVSKMKRFVQVPDVQRKKNVWFDKRSPGAQREGEGDWGKPLFNFFNKKN